jgi:hypothetical protein
MTGIMPGIELFHSVLDIRLGVTAEAADRLRAAEHQVLVIVGLHEICARIPRVIGAQSGTKGVG